MTYFTLRERVFMKKESDSDDDDVLENNDCGDKNHGTQNHKGDEKRRCLNEMVRTLICSIRDGCSKMQQYEESIQNNSTDLNRIQGKWNLLMENQVFREGELENLSLVRELISVVEFLKDECQVLIDRLACQEENQRELREAEEAIQELNRVIATYQRMEVKISELDIRLISVSIDRDKIQASLEQSLSEKAYVVKQLDEMKEECEKIRALVVDRDAYIDMQEGVVLNLRSLIIQQENQIKGLADEYDALVTNSEEKQDQLRTIISQLTTELDEKSKLYSSCEDKLLESTLLVDELVLLKHVLKQVILALNNNKRYYQQQFIIIASSGLQLQAQVELLSNIVSEKDVVIQRLKDFPQPIDASSDLVIMYKIIDNIEKTNVSSRASIVETFAILKRLIVRVNIDVREIKKQFSAVKEANETLRSAINTAIISEEDYLLAHETDDTEQDVTLIVEETHAMWQLSCVPYREDPLCNELLRRQYEEVVITKLENTIATLGNKLHLERLKTAMAETALAVKAQEVDSQQSSIDKLRNRYQLWKEKFRNVQNELIYVEDLLCRTFNELCYEIEVKESVEQLLQLILDSVVEEYEVYVNIIQVELETKAEEIVHVKYNMNQQLNKVEMDLEIDRMNLSVAESEIKTMQSQLVKEQAKTISLESQILDLTKQIEIKSLQTMDYESQLSKSNQKLQEQQSVVTKIFVDHAEVVDKMCLAERVLSEERIKHQNKLDFLSQSLIINSSELRSEKKLSRMLQKSVYTLKAHRCVLQKRLRETNKLKLAMRNKLVQMKLQMGQVKKKFNKINEKLLLSEESEVQQNRLYDELCFNFEITTRDKNLLLAELNCTKEKLFMSEANENHLNCSYVKLQSDFDAMSADKTDWQAENRQLKETVQFLTKELEAQSHIPVKDSSVTQKSTEIAMFDFGLKFDSQSNKVIQVEGSASSSIIQTAKGHTLTETTRYNQSELLASENLTIFRLQNEINELLLRNNELLLIVESLQDKETCRFSAPESSTKRLRNEKEHVEKSVKNKKLVTKIRAEYDKKYALQKEMHTKEVEQFNRVYRNNLFMMTTTHERDMKQLKALHYDSIVRLQQQHEEEIATVSSAYQKIGLSDDDVTALESRHHEELQQLKVTYEDLLKQQEKKLLARHPESFNKYKILSITERLEHTLEEVKENHKRELQKLEINYENRIEKIKEHHSNELNVEKEKITGHIRSMKMKNLEKLSCSKTKLCEINTSPMEDYIDVVAKDMKTDLVLSTELDSTIMNNLKSANSLIDFDLQLLQNLQNGNRSVNELQRLHDTIMCAMSTESHAKGDEKRVQFAERDSKPVEEARNELLVQRIKLLQSEILHMQSEMQSNSKRLESTIKREKSRLHEVRNLLDSELKRNLNLQNRLNCHLEKAAYTQHERDILRKQALHHKMRLDQTILLADKERARAESLKIKLTQILAHVHAKTRYASPLRTLHNQFHNAEENEHYLAYKLGNVKKIVEEKVNVNINITTSNDNVYGAPLGECSKGAFIRQCSSRHFIKKAEGKMF